MKKTLLYLILALPSITIGQTVSEVSVEYEYVEDFTYPTPRYDTIIKQTVRYSNSDWKTEILISTIKDDHVFSQLSSTTLDSSDTFIFKKLVFQDSLIQFARVIWGVNHNLLTRYNEDTIPIGISFYKKVKNSDQLIWSWQSINNSKLSFKYEYEHRKYLFGLYKKSLCYEQISNNIETTPSYKTVRFLGRQKQYDKRKGKWVLDEVSIYQSKKIKKRIDFPSRRKTFHFYPNSLEELIEEWEGDKLEKRIKKEIRIEAMPSKV